MPKFARVWPALVTPLTADDHINIEVTRRLVDDLIAAGVHGFYVCGGTGEGILLSTDSRKLMAETVLAQAKGRVPVIVHVGAAATADAMELAAHAQRLGADAVAAIPPFYYGVGFQAIKEHYQLIASASELPLYLYYIPGSTGVTLTAAQMWELCQIPKVAGFKYSAYDLYTLERILDLGKGRLNVFSGPDEIFASCLEVGVDGAIGSTYNFLPRHFIRLYEAARAGDWARVRELQTQGNRVIEVYLKHGGLATIKDIMAMQGYDCGHCRRPVGQLSPAQVAALRSDLEAVGFWNLV